jgi:hypothetical protein
MSRPAPDPPGPGLELDRSLAEDPRFLRDPAFLAALARELAARLGVDGAAAALLQLGFLHGLRDVSRVHGQGQLGTVGEEAASSRLPMRFASRPARGGRVPLEVRGLWPEAREARARGTGAAGPSGCVASAGYSSGWLSGLLGEDVLAVETTCRLRGDDACRFLARSVQGWQESGDAGAQRWLAQLPFPALRAALAALETPPAWPGSAPAFDPESPAVHVWGPVMVLPFAGADETLHAIELIGRDPGAREVAVVVLDLTGTLLDEGFGAVALERVLDAIRSWGAETVLTGVSPLSEPVVAGLEQPHLVVRKDLHEAIATAFRIAEASRRPV